MNKILFRGFHPDNNGTTTITLNGEKIKGEWVYGSLITLCERKYICYDRHYSIMDAGAFSDIVIPETVGQWVTTDRNDKDVFEGDIVKVYSLNGGYDNPQIEIVEFNTKSLCYEFYRWSGDIHDIETIGNIWEVEDERV